MPLWCRLQRRENNLAYVTGTNNSNPAKGRCIGDKYNAIDGKGNRWVIGVRKYSKYPPVTGNVTQSLHRLMHRIKNKAAKNPGDKENGWVICSLAEVAAVRKFHTDYQAHNDHRKIEKRQFLFCHACNF